MYGQSLISILLWTCKNLPEGYAPNGRVQFKRLSDHQMEGVLGELESSFCEAIIVQSLHALSLLAIVKKRLH